VSLRGHHHRVYLLIAMRPYAEANARAAYGQLHAAQGETKQTCEKYSAARAVCERLSKGLYWPRIERAWADLQSVRRATIAEHAQAPVPRRADTSSPLIAACDAPLSRWEHVPTSGGAGSLQATPDDLPPAVPGDGRYGLVPLFGLGLPTRLALQTRGTGGTCRATRWAPR
jgi:hypothetical protein